MSKYVVTKNVQTLDGVESPDLLVRISFRDRVSAIAYVRMYVEKKGYKITLGEYDFPVTGNMSVETGEAGVLSEEYQLVELIDDYSSEYDNVMKEVEEWTMDVLGRKFCN